MDEKIDGKVSSFADGKRKLEFKEVVIKNGPLKYKVAKLTYACDPKSGERKGESLTVNTYGKKKTSAGYDFSNPEMHWSASGTQEIQVLKALLDGVITDTAEWRKINPGSAAETLVNLVDQGKLSGEHASDLASALARSPAAVKALAESGAGRIFTQAIQQRERESALNTLEQVILSPGTTENDIQRILEKDWWMFGGRYIDKSKRRSITVLDQLDIPLIQFDGSLHVIELKGSYIPNLVVPHRNHHIPGDEVHEAVGQAMNYLRELDAQSLVIKPTLGIDCTRSSATVVIGNTAHCKLSKSAVEAAIRTYNSHLSRVEIVTYDQLVQNIRNALQIGSGLPEK